MVTTWTDVNKIGFTQVHNWTILSKTCGERSLLCDSFWNIKIQLGQSHKFFFFFNGSVCKAVIVIYHYCLNHIERSECSFRSITEWFQLQYQGYFSSRVECVYIYTYIKRVPHLYQHFLNWRLNQWPKAPVAQNIGCGRHMHKTGFWLSLHPAILCVKCFTQNALRKMLIYWNCFPATWVGCVCLCVCVCVILFFCYHYL